MKLRKIAAGIAAAAVFAAPTTMAATNLMSTTAYAEDYGFKLTVDGKEVDLENGVCNITDGDEHTYKIEFSEGAVCELQLGIKGKSDTVFPAMHICEFSTDIPIIVYGGYSGFSTNWGHFAHGDVTYLSNLYGEDVDYRHYDNNGVDTVVYPEIIIGSKTGKGKGSFTFEGSRAQTVLYEDEGSSDYVIWIPRITFTSETAGTVEFTIKPYDGEAQTPDDEKPDETEKKTVEFKNEETNVSVSAAEGVVPDGAELSVTPGEISDTQAEYDICFMKDGKEVQPNGKVTVKLPIPEALKGKTIYVYRAEADGTYTKMKSKVDGDFVSFETDHFSKYLLSTVEIEGAKAENPDTGAAGISVVLGAAAIAGAAVIAARRKKR